MYTQFCNLWHICSQKSISVNYPKQKESKQNLCRWFVVGFRARERDIIDYIIFYFLILGKVRDANGMPMHFTLVFLSAEESISLYIPVLKTMLVNKKFSVLVPIKYNTFFLGGREKGRRRNFKPIILSQCLDMKDIVCLLLCLAFKSLYNCLQGPLDQEFKLN